MTFTLRIELNKDDATNFDETLSPDDIQPIIIELVDKVTLGRGEDTAILIGQTEAVDLDSNQAFNREMQLLTNPHIDLAMFNAHKRGVSRKHARITLHNTRMSVSDLGSTNGTYVNNQRLETNIEYPLKSGDDLRLGFMTLHVFLE
ncbi:MAG: hypothetical protein Phog2KO_14360 [Phototrophicaceae bacterium]